MTEVRTHGGTDSGPRPAADFSSNANALGPAPDLLAVLRTVDVAHYPDPAYAAARATIARHHGVAVDEVVVGAGASEIIGRCVALTGGPVVVWQPTFGEYVDAAVAHGAPVVVAHDAASFVAAIDEAAIAFVCQPNNPDGRVVDAATCRRIAAAARRSGATVVVDLAYEPLCQVQVDRPPGAWRLYSPNKALGATGVRAAYLLSDPASAAALRSRAPSWVVSAYGEAFLRAAADPRVTEWVRTTRRRVWAWRDELAADLGERGIDVTRSPATWLLADVGDAAGLTRALRRRRIRVRDATSFGLPRHVRLSAQPPTARRTLMDALDEVGGRRGPA